MGRVEPLVRVEADRIGTVDALEEGGQFGGQRSRAPVGGVDVEPDAVLGAGIGDL